MARWVRFFVASGAVCMAFTATWLVGELVLDRETAQALGGLASAVAAGVVFWWATLDRSPPRSGSQPAHAVEQMPGAARSEGSPNPVPRQLPASGGMLVGRSLQMQKLDEILLDEDRRARIAVLTGTAGVGKTALAVEWAQGARDAFPRVAAEAPSAIPDYDTAVILAGQIFDPILDETATGTWNPSAQAWITTR